MTGSWRRRLPWPGDVTYFLPGTPWSHDLRPLKQVESFGGPITLLRVGVVGVVVIILQSLAVTHLVVRDFAVYVAMTLVQTLVVTCLPPVVGRAGAALIFCTCLGVGLAWTNGLVHLWMAEAFTIRMLALMGLLWWLIYAVTARRNDAVMMTATLLAMAIALTALPLVSWLVLDQRAEAMLLVVTNGVGFAFYLNGIRDVRVMRRTLLQAESAVFEQSKTEALGRLTGGVAHDFNNLLTVISGNLELVRHIDDPHERKLLLREAAKAAERAALVTGQLLSYSRRAAMRPERVDVAASIAELGMLLRRLLTARITFDSQVLGPLPPLFVDKSQFDTVLLNLAINARDALPDGGQITIRVLPERVASNTYRTGEGTLSVGEYLRIEVEDNGTGMTPEVLSRAFEPYFTTKPKGRGTGMGLSMGRGFAEQSGGLLPLRSAPGLGTIATLILPVAEQATDP